jgi:3-methyladenine DNA glycosylase AlkC
MYYRHLPPDFDKAVAILEKVAPKNPAGFEQLIGPTFVEFYGLEHFERSMLALSRLTRFSTGEFAIRPFIKKWPKKTMEQMKEWSRSEDEHIRRLSSEGCRPRLPWGGNLNVFIENPTPVLKLLEGLKNDSSLYVRKSVANNINDISKDHPQLVLDTCTRWLGQNHEHAQWIVKKALRTLLKRADPDALQLFGYGNPKFISVGGLMADMNVRIGERLNFECIIRNQSKKIQKCRIEYLIEYQKKSGKSTKVFQFMESELKPEEVRRIKKYQPFHDMTTRKHFPGKHKLFIRVNGVVLSECSFEVLP